VVKINGSPVNDCSDFTRLLRKRADNKASVTVMRERKEQTLTLTLPENKRTGALNQTEDCEAAELEDCGEDVQAEITQLLPEMLTVEVKRIQPEMEKMKREVQKEFLDHRKDFQKEMEKMQKELHRQQKELKEQMKNWMKAADI
jgi:endonuclease YncB( thermonuclease family)